MNISATKNSSRILKSAAPIALALAALVTLSGHAMANAKDKCIAAGGTWAAVGGDQTSWTCYRPVKKIIKKKTPETTK